LLERRCREEKKIRRGCRCKKIKNFPRNMLEAVLIDKYDRWILADLVFDFVECISESNDSNSGCHGNDFVEQSRFRLSILAAS
jgi:hypothetical protein